jgi:hypothetical protein
VPQYSVSTLAIMFSLTPPAVPPLLKPVQHPRARHTESAGNRFSNLLFHSYSPAAQMIEADGIFGASRQKKACTGLNKIFGATLEQSKKGLKLISATKATT